MKNPDIDGFLCRPDQFKKGENFKPWHYKRFINAGDRVHIFIEPYFMDGRVDFAYETLLRIAREKTARIEKLTEDLDKTPEASAEISAEIKRIKDSILVLDKIRRPKP